MKILITGATGFIGSHILKLLAENNFEVMAMYRNESKVDRSVKCLWQKLDENWITSARRFAPDIIIHTAWVGVTAAERTDWQTQILNITLQQQLLELRPKQFIALGSQAEYGTYEAIVDESFPANPTSAYGAAKLACLDLMRVYCELYGIAWKWFRVFSTFGEGEAATWLIPSAIKKMKSDTQMDTTLGEQRYSYLYVGEIARIIVMSVATNAPNGIYNLSGSKTISIRELLEKIRDYVNPNFVLHFGAIPYRPGQSMLMGCNNNKVSELIGPVTDSYFEEALKQTIDSYLNK